MKDIVFNLCQQMLAHSPEASYKRLNPALRSTLGNCIKADLPFQADTFRRIYNELRGGWWFGDGAGSNVGEHFYTTACGCNHSTAQQSFEQFAGRPACLWEEDAKTPERLHVGARFTWKGHHVTITSMKATGLVACTYRDYRPAVKGLKIGATIGYDPEYLITSSKQAGAVTKLEVIKAKKTDGDRQIAKRFQISYEEISTYRKESKAKLKAMLEKIATCDPQKDANKLTAEINAASFRHWELESIRDGFRKRKEWQANQGKIEDWRAGKDGAWLDVKQVLLRVNGDRVECSNGNGVSKAAASRVLPVLLANRNKSTALSLPVDSYTINRAASEGVKIGCTLVPWAEIDLITPQLS